MTPDPFIRPAGSELSDWSLTNVDPYCCTISPDHIAVQLFASEYGAPRPVPLSNLQESAERFMTACLGIAGHYW